MIFYESKFPGPFLKPELCKSRNSQCIKCQNNNNPAYILGMAGITHGRRETEPAQVHQNRKNDSAKKKGSCCGTKYFFWDCPRYL